MFLSFSRKIAYLKKNNSAVHTYTHIHVQKKFVYLYNSCVKRVNLTPNIV